MRKQPRYDQIMAALEGGEPYDAIAKRFRMTERDVWVYDNVRTHGFPSELPSRQAGQNDGKNMRIFTAYELVSIDARHRAGESLDALAKEYRTGDSTLRRALQNNGYSTNRQSPKSDALKTTEAARKERHERYLWYKSHGICTECEKRPAAIGLTRCPECAERLASKPSRITPERRHELYLRRKANGVCTCCKSRKAEEGKVKCRECARKQHIAYMRRRVLRVRPDGQCIRCENQARPGSKLCEKHYAEAVRQCAYMRAKANPKAHVWHADNEIVFQTRRPQP